MLVLVYFRVSSSVYGHVGMKSLKVSEYEENSKTESVRKEKKSRERKRKETVDRKDVTSRK